MEKARRVHTIPYAFSGLEAVVPRHKNFCRVFDRKTVFPGLSPAERLLLYMCAGLPAPRVGVPLGAPALCFFQYVNVLCASIVGHDPALRVPRS